MKRALFLSGIVATIALAACTSTNTPTTQDDGTSSLPTVMDESSSTDAMMQQDTSSAPAMMDSSSQYSEQY